MAPRLRTIEAMNTHPTLEQPSPQLSPNPSPNLSPHPPSRRRLPDALPLPRWSRVLIALLAFGVAAYALAAYLLLPLGSAVHPDMQIAFQARPWLIYTHVFASVVALALGPLQFSATLRRRRIALHRWAGRAYLGVGVLLGGASGLGLAFFAHGGPVARWGFGLLALGWLASGALALRAVRRGRIDAHRRWMLRNYALTLAAVTLRLLLPASMALGLDFDRSYAAIAWLCWVPNLLAAQWLIGRWERQAPPADLTGAAYRSR